MINSKQQFEQLQKSYQPDSSKFEKIDQSKLCFLISPSAVGRNTIIRQMIEDNRFQYMVSDTTRKPRINNGQEEVSGNEYNFIDEAAFLERIKKQHYLEFAIVHNQQVSGLPMDALMSDKYLVAEVEKEGSENISRLLPRAKLVFVLPPSFEEWMQRMDARGEMPIDEKRNRLRSAEKELTYALQSDKLDYLINHDYRQAAERLKSYMIDGQPLDQKADVSGLIESLLEKLNKK